MLHVRIVSPADRTSDVIAVLRADVGVTNIVLWPGAAIEPAGDVVSCDVAREEANTLLEALRRFDLDERGSIAIENVDTSISRVARDARRSSPGTEVDAVVWEEVESRTSEESRLSFTYLAFLVVATLIAAVGVLLDSTVLIVGAMVVGPEFGAVAGVAVAIVRRQGREARRSLAALVVGFPLAIVAAFVASLLFRAGGLVPDGFELTENRLTAFVSRPDEFAVIVALLAGVAGILSLTSTKSGALIGVLISVTTVPAAGATGLAAALGEWGDAAGALAQLVVNLVCLVAAGTATLWVQRRRYAFGGLGS